jgi:hypothetical protein
MLEADRRSGLAVLRVVVRVLRLILRLLGN